MNILIACHDKFDKDHPPIYITNDITKKSIQYNIYTKKGLADAQKELGIARVDYIDTLAEKLDDNQYNDWSKLPVKYDIVFHVHCPTYGLFHYDADNMPKESWMNTPKYWKMEYDFYFNIKKVLKPNGYLQIPFSYKLNKDGNLENKNEEFGKYWNDDDNLQKIYKMILGKLKYKLDIIKEPNKEKIPFYAGLSSKYEGFATYKDFRYVLLRFPSGKQTRKASRKHK